jgi:16S rRNA (guanine966-N2)-methyltransferase
MRSFLVTMPLMEKRSSRGQAGTLRIIGGRWRGRRFPCPPGDATRPTGDRIRETVFNWLAPFIDGSRCLDLFAGTGALGLEALSRGANEVLFVEQNACAARRIEATLRELDCFDVDVIKGDALQFLAGTPRTCDIVFLDPPFGIIDLENLCTLLDKGWLARGSYIYIEMRRGAATPQLPPGWTLTRDKTAGQVHFMLACRVGD